MPRDIFCCFDFGAVEDFVSHLRSGYAAQKFHAPMIAEDVATPSRNRLFGVDRGVTGVSLNILCFWFLPVWFQD